MKMVKKENNQRSYPKGAQEPASRQEPLRGKKMKRPLVIVGCVVVVAVIVFLLVTLYNCRASVSDEDDSGEVSLLFVQTSHSGTLSAADSDNMRTLTLNNVSPTTVFFSDRPYRETGHESTREFIDEWSEGENSFSINPPNAALDILGENSQSVIVLELMNPVYDEGAKTLRYDVIVLEEEGTNISEYGEELDLSVPQLFDEAALFIDSTYRNYYCSCVPSKGHPCWCDYDYNLKAGLTKEFRFNCNQGDAEDKVTISGTKRDTTCTIMLNYATYATRSCTNWHIGGSDGIHLRIKCVSHKDW